MPSWSPNCPDGDAAPSTSCRRCRLGTSYPRAHQVRHRRRQGPRQAARPPTRTACIGPQGDEDPRVGRGWSKLPVDRPPCRAQQEHGRSNPATCACGKPTKASVPVLEDSDGVSDTQGGCVSAARGARRAQHPRAAWLRGLKVTQSCPTAGPLISPPGDAKPRALTGNGGSTIPKTRCGYTRFGYMNRA
jgi:hypothetical protein